MEQMSEVRTSTPVGLFRDCGSCCLSQTVLQYANGADVANCRGPVSFSRTEIVSYGSHSAPYTQEGVRCPTYQSGGDGHVEYNIV
jgi:hypothetical protein